jgi:hypothetical protein
MKGVTAAKVMLIIALALLIVYGLDTAVARTSSSDGMNTGFLPINTMVRGLVFGGSSIALSVIAFFIAKDISRFVWVMLMINGALITTGGIVASSAPVTALGVLVIALGVIKRFRDARIAKII